MQIKWVIKQKEIQMINVALIGFGYWGPNVAKNIHANKELNLYATKSKYR